MTTVISGFSPAGKTEYGDRFLETFDRHWPKSVNLICYVESDNFPSGRAQIRSLWLCDGIHAFIERHKDNKAHTGRSAVKGWRPKDVERGYCYRFDAVKFSRQMVIPHHAASHLPDGEVMAWMDADVLTFADVPDGLLEGLLGNADLAYLGRGNFHSEIGCWIVRLNPVVRGFLAALSDAYVKDKVFRLPEWHSAFVFDHYRKQFEAKGLKAKNLTPGGRGHVWFQCAPLAAVSDHLKGKRKALDRSPERPA